MANSEGHAPVLGNRAVLAVPGNYQPVHVEDTTGVIILGILTGILLIGWMCSEARYRKLLMQKERTNGNHEFGPG